MASNISPTRDEIQLRAIEAQIARKAAGDRSMVLQKPTQVGKTRTQCMLIARSIREWDARWMVAVHLGELMEQWADELTALDVPFVIEKAGQKSIDKLSAFRGVVCLASQQSLRGDRLLRMRPDTFTDIVFDECHLSVAPSWVEIREHFAPATLYGCSATIDRLDGVPLATLYDSSAFTYPITEAIANGHRVPFRCVELDVPVDIRGLKPSDVGKFTAADVAARLMPKLDPIARAVKEHLRRLGIKKWIAFLPNLACVYAFADLMSQHGHPARGVDHKNPDRKGVIASHKAGEYEGLCNQKLLGMGYSDRQVEAVILLNPTMSRAWYDQMAGRGGATCEGKEFDTLIYPRWTCERELMGPTDIFSGDMDARVRSRARKKAEGAEDEDPQDLLDRAMDEVEAEDLAEDDYRRDMEDRQYRYRANPDRIEHLWKQFDPLARHGVVRAVAPEAVAERAHRDATPCTEAEAKLLRGYGLDPEGMTGSQARPLIRSLMDREFSGLADPRDIMALRTLCGVPMHHAVTMTADEAGVQIAAQLARQDLRRSRGKGGPRISF